jgi:hypothetical protein
VIMASDDRFRRQGNQAGQVTSERRTQARRGAERGAGAGLYQKSLVVGNRRAPARAAGIERT